MNTAALREQIQKAQQHEAETGHRLQMRGLNHDQEGAQHEQR